MKFTNMNPTVERNWVVIDAEDKIFGRVITEIATILRGKNKPYYTPNIDCGDFVVVINAGKVKFSKENKADDKKYYRHSGHPGGLKTTTALILMKKKPEEILKTINEKSLKIKKILNSHLI